MIVWRLVVVCVVLAFTGTARAEDKFDPALAPALEKALAPLAPVKAELLKQTLRLTAAARTPGKVAPSGLKKKPLTTTDFKPAFEGRPVLDAVMMTMPGAAEDKKAIRQMIETILTELAKDFRPNNLGASVAVAIAICALIVDDVDLAEKGSKDLVQTMSDVLASQPAVLKLSAREKHAVSEQLLTMSALAMTFYASAKASNDETSMKASRGIATALLTTLIGKSSSLP